MKNQPATRRAKKPSAAERRRYGRLRDQCVQSSVGPVVDISAGGIRVLSPHPLKGELKCVLGSGPGSQITLQARVIWRRRLGFRRHVVGLKFVNLTPGVARALAQIRTGGRINSEAIELRPANATKPQHGGGLMLWLGALLLLSGFALYHADRVGWLDQVPFMQDTDLKTFLIIAGIVPGALFLAFGLVARLITKGRRERERPVVRKLRTSHDLLSCILESSLSGVMVLKAVRDGARQIVDLECQLVNTAAEQLLGRSASDLLGWRMREHLPWLSAVGLFDDAQSIIETDLPVKEERFCAHDGRWYQVAAVRLEDGIVVTFADINDKKQTEEKLRHAADHDALTGLPNRKLLTERLEQAIYRGKRFSNHKFALLFLDFDRFKIINDSLGHEVGDELLVNIAKQLQAQLRIVDTPSRLDEGYLPARLGGDEFVVLLERIDDVQDAVVVAERLLNAFSEPHLIAGHEVISTASIGIVTSEGGYKQPDDLLRDADTAMYQAKAAGRARYVIFDQSMHQAAMDRLHLEKELREAVDREAFELVYEPIVSIDSGRLAGFEALIRWLHPERGLVLPEAFIGLAEELGLISTIGQWVLQQACRQLRAWQEHWQSDTPLFVSVNLSKHQLRDPDLVPMVGRVIEETGIAPRTLRLEITENMIMDDLEEMATVLNRLRQLGTQLAMDDFGTGHSSLNCLHRFPLEVLKIDRSFINSEGKNKREYAAIIHTTMELAHNLNMRVIAEGVQSIDQLTLLQGLNCDFAQGRLFSAPIGPQEAQRFLGHDYRFCTPAQVA